MCHARCTCPSQPLRAEGTVRFCVYCGGTLPERPAKVAVSRVLVSQYAHPRGETRTDLFELRFHPTKGLTITPLGADAVLSVTKWRVVDTADAVRWLAQVLPVHPRGVRLHEASDAQLLSVALRAVQVAVRDFAENTPFLPEGELLRPNCVLQASTQEDA